MTDMTDSFETTNVNTLKIVYSQLMRSSDADAKSDEDGDAYLVRSNPQACSATRNGTFLIDSDMRRQIKKPSQNEANTNKKISRRTGGSTTHNEVISINQSTTTTKAEIVITEEINIQVERNAEVSKPKKNKCTLF